METIVELLKNVLSKWKELGIQLGLSDVDLKVIAGVDTCRDNLRELLASWIDFYDREATIDKLVAAARSGLREDNTLADSLTQDEELKDRFGPECKWRV